MNLFQESGVGWSWEPSVLLGLAVLTGVYLWITGPLQKHYAPGKQLPFFKKLSFHAGTFSLFIALVSPLDVLADDYLFSAHMLQHVLMLYVTPPLWLIGLPDWIVEGNIWGNIPKRLTGFLSQPVFAFLIFNGVMWVWHIPNLYDAALANEILHIFEHLMFISAAVVGWWLVLGPLPKPAHRGQPITRSIYLFLSTFPCTALAALITLSTTVLYTFYGAHPWQWGLSPLLDQQIGGLIMWLPADMILIGVNVALLYRWFNDPNRIQTI